MSTEVIITLVGLVVATLAAILGIWVERDERKPPRYAYALSILIVLATIVGMFQTYNDAMQSEKLEGDMARMLQTLDKLAAASDGENPELDAFVKGEIAAQSRANPSVVEKLAQRVSDEGGDATAVLARNLPAADVESMQRKGGLDLKPTTVVPKPTIALGGPAGADGKKRGGLRLMPKKGDGEDGDDPSVAAAAPGDDEAKDDEPKPTIDAKALGGKTRLSLGGAKSDDAAKTGDAPKGGGLVGAKPAAPAAAADAPKPKLKPRL